MSSPPSCVTKPASSEPPSPPDDFHSRVATHSVAHLHQNLGGAGWAVHYDAAVTDKATRVSFLGPHGTYAEEALRTQEDLCTGDLVAERTVSHVINAVEVGDSDLGLVPIENSIEGSVTVTLDTLAFDSDLLIQREIDLPVSLHLCAREGTRLGDVRTIVTFPHASAQCRAWLGKKIPDADVEASNSTAEAARTVAKGRRDGVAAICSRFAAEIYGLRVIASEIEDHPEAQTRFVVLGHGVPSPTGHDKTSLVCFQREDRPGSLLAILQEFAARAVNLTKLESRPTKRSLGEYCFFIDAEGHIADELVADTLRTLMAKQADVKFLGSYPIAGDRDGRRKRVGKAWREATSWVEDLRSRIRHEDKG
jgi:prephenate dehydratase